MHCLFPQRASTPLHLAARRGHSEVVKAIVANETANVNAADQAHNEHNFEPYCFAGRRLTVRPVHSMPRPLPPAIVCFATIDGKIQTEHTNLRDTCERQRAHAPPHGRRTERHRCTWRRGGGRRLPSRRSSPGPPGPGPDRPVSTSQTGSDTKNYEL